MSGGTSALLSVLILPFLTNIYAPDAYAQFALATAVVSTVCVVVTGRYEQAIPLVWVKGGDNHAAAALARVALLSSLVVCLSAELLVTILLLVSGQSDGGLSLVLLAVPPLTFLGSLGSIQSMMLTGMGRFNSIALHQATRVLTQLLMQVLFGLVEANVYALLLGFAVGLLPSSVHSLWLIFRPSSVGLADMKRMAVEQRDMPVYQVPVMLIRGLEANAVLFALALGYGDDLVGLFALSSRVLLGPGIVLASSVNTVFLHESTTLRKEGQHAFLRKTFALLGGALLLTSLLAILSFRPLQGLLGPEWSGTSSMMVACLPFLGAALLGAVPSTVLVALGRSRELLWWRTAMMLLPALTMLLSGVVGLAGLFAVALAGITQLGLAVALHLRAVRIVEST